MPLLHPFLAHLCYSIHLLSTYLCYCLIHSLHTCVTPSTHWTLTCAIAASIPCTLVLLHPLIEHLLVLLPHPFMATPSTHWTLTCVIATSTHCTLVLLHPLIEHLLLLLPHPFIAHSCWFIHSLHTCATPSTHWALTCAIASSIHCYSIHSLNTYLCHCRIHSLLLYPLIEHLLVLLPHPLIAHVLKNPLIEHLLVLLPHLFLAQLC